MNSPGKLLVRSLIFCSILLAFCFPSFAETGGAVQEVTAEATYQMNDNDTLSQAEGQTLLRAKKNAVEQVSSSSVTMEDVASLSNDILKVTVLDKKTNLNGTKIECWMQIQAAVQPEKLEAALKGMRGYDEYFYESTVYLKGGDEKIRTKVWSSKKMYREDRIYYGMPLTIIKRPDDQVVQALCNNKYYEETVKTQETPTPIDDLPIDVEVKQLGNEMIFDITAQKRLRTQTYADGKVLKEVQWNDPATNWVIKRETSVSTVNKTSVTECRNIKLGPQNAALFVIPVGYTKCATFAELFSDGNVGTSQSTQTDPLQKATDAALEAAAQRVVDGAIGGLFNF